MKQNCARPLPRPGSAQAQPRGQSSGRHLLFETLVRIHRAGEGAPYTGLKPAGTVEPPIAMADRSLEGRLAKAIASHAEAGVRERFQHALTTKQHAQESVAAGRECGGLCHLRSLRGGVAQAVHAESHHGAAAAPAHQLTLARQGGFKINSRRTT